MSEVALLMALLAFESLLPALPPPAEDVESRLRKVETELESQKKENAELRKELETVQRRQFELEGGHPDAPGAGAAADVDSEPAAGSLEERATKLQERHGSHGGVYDKPFLRSVTRRSHLGGYIDLEYHDSRDSDRRFAQHRFVPFIYVDATDRLKFAAEIEFEFGGGDSAAEDGETKVEFATMDYVFHKAVAFRAGAILVPLGKFNLIHDSPVNDLTNRPLVDRVIIPTTLTEAGLGFYGALPPLGDWDVNYEIYLVNGFTGLDRDGTAKFSESKGLRSGRASLKVDNNNSAAGVGRISVSPLLGTELGGSLHLGKYDEAGDLWLALWAIDLIFKPGIFVEALTPFEFQGEFASAELERNTRARSSGVPDEAWGSYGQINYHFMFPGFTEGLPMVFGDESTFTTIVRVDHVEIDSTREERITFGLNFRPTEDTVFKFDYELNFEDWHRDKVRNDAFLFSVATYF